MREYLIKICWLFLALIDLISCRSLLQDEEIDNEIVDFYQDIMSNLNPHLMVSIDNLKEQEKEILNKNGLVLSGLNGLTTGGDILGEAKRFAYMAGLAYCSNKSILDWNCVHCKKIKGLKLYRIIKYEPLNLRAIILIDDKNRDLIISFRGSDGFYQAKELISLEQVSYLDQEDFKVQKEFMKRITVLSSSILKALESTKFKYYFYRKVLVGHSFGGAMAVLFAPMLNKYLNILYNDIAVFTYGQPRVGNIAFAKWYNNLPLFSIRVVNGRDWVPHLVYTQDFIHTKNELFIDDKTILCSMKEMEDPKCSNKYTFYSLSDSTHNQVWEIKLGNKACLAP